VLNDSAPEHVAWVEQAYRDNALARIHMDANPATKLKNLSSIAFGGPGLLTGYMGCLLGGQIGSVPLPVRGVRPVHWNY
jgi:hypothetical protein